MASQDEEQEFTRHRLVESAELRELFRYERGDDIRIYGLRVVAQGAELWRVTETPDQPTTSIKESDLASTDQTLQIISDIERMLQAGGWRKLSAP